MSAVLSADRRYRYILTRELNIGRHLVPVERSLTWVMLNPSTADADKDDPTVRRVRTLSMEWGATRFCVVNLFAFRATDPRDLPFDTREGAGPEWSTYMGPALRDADAVVCAWGARVRMRNPDWRAFYELLNAARRPTLCLGLTKCGEPRHPLYMPTGTALVPFVSRHLAPSELAAT